MEEGLPGKFEKVEVVSCLNMNMRQVLPCLRFISGVEMIVFAGFAVVKSLQVGFLTKNLPTPLLPIAILTKTHEYTLCRD